MDNVLTVRNTALHPIRPKRLAIFTRATRNLSSAHLKVPTNLLADLSKAHIARIIFLRHGNVPSSPNLKYFDWVLSSLGKHQCCDSALAFKSILDPIYPRVLCHSMKSIKRARGGLCEVKLPLGLIPDELQDCALRVRFMSVV